MPDAGSYPEADAKSRCLATTAAGMLTPFCTTNELLLNYVHVIVVKAKNRAALQTGGIYQAPVLLNVCVLLRNRALGKGSGEVFKPTEDAQGDTNPCIS
ncbi:hypothetical protein HGM15179_018784 [Zosterops borbonicus]|uniref:Uncharacterized protein n=1 Tax=Zosterops borbonicus TaxID=364589 RepID=A0A8K1FYE7_9PASS|nr:hypothetical protein HGM15179_018784 [Zosterops borbonicus]